MTIHSESTARDPVAWVTGGSRGIGLACARHLAGLGYCVLVSARHMEPLQAACDQAQAEGLNLQPLPLDISDLNSIERAFAEHECLKDLDVLVHAAGTGAFSSITHGDDPCIWQRVMRTNLDGAYYCARSALLAMTAHEVDRPRRLVFISSVLGLKGMGNSHAYCASKHGVNGLVRALAQDTAARQITVNSICPGWVDTQMAHQDFQTMADHYQIPVDMLISDEIQAVPIQRWIQSDEVAALVGYVCSEAAGALTGQCLELSGGL